MRCVLRPRWLVFHVVCLAAVVAMVNLGLWQLRRLDEKRDFNDRVRAAVTAPATEWAPGSAEPSEYRQAIVVGTYLDREFEVVNVSQDGASGRDQVLALGLPDGSVLIVNRGFVPGRAAFAAVPDGEVEVTGRVRGSQSPRRGQVADDPGAQLTQIRRVDLEVLAAQFDRPVQPFALEALTENGTPVPGMTPIAFPALDEGPHLGYAIQWFVFCIAVVVGWALAVRKSREAGRATSGEVARRQRPLIPEQYR